MLASVMRLVGGCSLVVLLGGCAVEADSQPQVRDPVEEGDSGAPDTAGNDSGASDDDSGASDDDSGASDTGEPEPGACVNEADQSIHDDPVYDPDGKATMCALEDIALLLSEQWEAFDASFAVCMADTSYRGEPSFAFALSDACASCYGAERTCVVQFCSRECGTDPLSEACVTCRDTAGCVDGFAVCSGLPAR